MNDTKTINVLVVDDSPTIRQLLVHIVSSVPGLQVVGQARDGAEAIRLTQRLKPDVISMDVHMPQMDGFEATREIMRTQPTPIVVVSASLEKEEMDIAFDAMQAGALAVIEKPAAPEHPNFGFAQNEFVSTLQIMAGVKVIHHFNPRPLSREIAASPPLPRIPAGELRTDIVGIAASTGGPSAINKILRATPANFPLPIVVTQHLSAGFDQGLAQWLDGQCELAVQVARDGQRLEAGQVLVAPCDIHLKVSRHGRVLLEQDDIEKINIPSANVMFKSLAEVYGARAMGVVLTGMGADGASGLLELYKAGGMTLAQDEESSVVYGMPKQAVNFGAVHQIVALDEMAAMIWDYAVGEPKA